MKRPFRAQHSVIIDPEKCAVRRFINHIGAELKSLPSAAPSVGCIIKRRIISEAQAIAVRLRGLGDLRRQRWGGVDVCVGGDNSAKHHLVDHELVH